MRNTKGQNAIEYVLLVVAVVMVCLVFLNTKGPMRHAIGNSLNTTMVGQLQFISNEIKFNTNP